MAPRDGYRYRRSTDGELKLTDRRELKKTCLEIKTATADGGRLCGTRRRGSFWAGRGAVGVSALAFYLPKPEARCRWRCWCRWVLAATDESDGFKMLCLHFLSEDTAPVRSSDTLHRDSGFSMEAVCNQRSCAVGSVEGGGGRQRKEKTKSKQNTKFVTKRRPDFPLFTRQPRHKSMAVENETE